MLATLAAAGPLAHVGHWGWGFGFFPFFFLIPLFWIAVIVVLAIVFGRRRRFAARNGYGPWGWGGPGGQGWHGWQGQQAARNAESTLAERYAQGDIDEKEYRARLEVLRANTPQPPTPPAG